MARTLALYRSIRGLLAPILVAATLGIFFIATTERFEEVAIATAGILPVALLVYYGLARKQRQGPFLAELFMWGFLVRVFLGLVIYHFELWDFYGGDSNTYDFFGWELAQYWKGNQLAVDWMFLKGSNPGIVVFTAIFYYVFGHHLLLIQFALSAVGAGTAILIVHIADELFGDREVSMLSGLCAAFFPSIVIWTCQLMKESLVLFLICLIVYSIQRVSLRFRYRYLIYIVSSLLAIHFLRFYLFYSIVAAMVVAMLVPPRSISLARLMRHVTVSVIVLVSATLLVGRIGLGGRSVLETFQHDTDLATIQEARLDQATGGQTVEGPASAFREEADVSTPAGALRHFPYGFVYVMFGPFPWEIRNSRQALALPEALIWWLMVPAFLRGLRLAARHRMPESWMILVLCAGVLLPYSFSQGNVGTAYRQRIQFQIFFFIFVALGYVWKRRMRLGRAMVGLRRPTRVRVATVQT